ncbi:MAG: prephenate dehydrogenase/arogenate dehydrogenase family protein [Patescibacteria group bacterium]
MISKRIAIFGCNGQYGQWLTRFFQDRGCGVMGCDAPHKMHSPFQKNQRIVDMMKWAEVVIFAVPIKATVDLIRTLTPLSRSDQLWLDITSIKAPAVAAMLESKAEVVGMHPLFAPPQSDTWEGLTVAICPVRLNEWKPWFQSLMRELKATVKVIDAREHDKLMLHSQNMPHLCALAQAMLLRLFVIEPQKLLVYGTPVSRKQYEMVARILSKPPEVYADIQMHNPDSLVMIDALIKSLERLRSIIARGDREAFIAEFLLLREYFGEAFLADVLASSEQKKK